MKTLVIDTVDRLFPMCMDYVCEKHSMEHPSDEAYGKGWSLVRKEFERVIQKVNLANCATIFVAHETERKVKVKNVETSVIQPDVPKTGLDIMFDLSDMILYYSMNADEQRHLDGSPSKSIKVGCRGGIQINLINPTFKTMNECVKKAGYDSFEKLKPTMLIYGPPKIGKSTLCADFPDPMVMDLENGYKFIKCDKHLVSSWVDFLSKCKEIIK